MKDNLVEMIFILDRSGSMQGLEKDTIGGFNSMIEKQKELKGDAIVSTVLFNHDFKVLHNRIKIKDVMPMTDKDYYVSGTTALLDAVGRSIHKIDNIFKHIPKEFQANKVIFVITTDGMENSSVEYNYQSLKKMIEAKKENNNWEFIFLGANIDAVKVASKFGINENRTANYHADEIGTKLNYETISKTISSLRMHNKLDEKWKEDIDKDYNKR